MGSEMCIRDRLKIILTSGYSEEIIELESKSQTQFTFLAKPFRYQQLLDTVRLALLGNRDR